MSEGDKIYQWIMSEVGQNSPVKIVRKDWHIKGEPRALTVHKVHCRKQREYEWINEAELSCVLRRSIGAESLNPIPPASLAQNRFNPIPLPEILALAYVFMFTGGL